MDSVGLGRGDGINLGAILHFLDAVHDDVVPGLQPLGDDPQRAGTVTVRIHDSPHWAVDGGNACTVASPGGWLVIKRLVPGEVRVSQALRGTRCDVDK